ncbi:MAG: hypothetical protein EHM47_12420, partial [Ignavibacteriales bacterium]
MIRKLFVLTFFISLQIFFSKEFFAQSLDPEFIWANNFGGIDNDGSFDIVADHSGNIIAAGSFANT